MKSSLIYKNFISYQPKNSQKNGVDIRAESMACAQTSNLVGVRLNNDRT